MKNYIPSRIILTILTISFKIIFKKLLEKLNLLLVLFLYEKYGFDHDPTFMIYINFDDGYRRYVIYNDKVSTKKEVWVRSGVQNNQAS